MLTLSITSKTKYSSMVLQHPVDFVGLLMASHSEQPKGSFALLWGDTSLSPWILLSRRLGTRKGNLKPYALNGTPKEPINLHRTLWASGSLATRESFTEGGGTVFT